MKVFLLILLVSSSAFALDSSKCSTMLNNGMYKKYKFAGVGEANTKAITGETKSAGSFKATSHLSTEGSTVTLDPKYSTNVSVSNTQVSSSWGDCSLFALQERKIQRDLYIAQNFDQIKKDIANGNGEHMTTLAWYALCDDNAASEYSKTLQNNFEKLSSEQESSFSKVIDQTIEENSALKTKCLSLTSL